MGEAANAVERAKVNTTEQEKAFSEAVSYARQGTSWMPTE
jgi:hypothetical protein